jgi:hypothetical protein
MAPDRDGALEAGDELMFLIDPDHETELSRFLSPRAHIGVQAYDLDHRASPGGEAPSRAPGAAIPSGPAVPTPLKVLTEDLPATPESAGPSTHAAAMDEPDLPFEE